MLVGHSWDLVMLSSASSCQVPWNCNGHPAVWLCTITKLQLSQNARRATNQGVGSSNLSGRANHVIRFNDLRTVACPNSGTFGHAAGKKDSLDQLVGRVRQR